MIAMPGRHCDDCRCDFGNSDLRRTISEIKNRGFRRVRERLAPADDAYPFHFAVLESHPNEIVSRGLDSAKVDEKAARKYAEIAHQAAIDIIKDGRPLNVTEVLRRLAPNGEILEDVRNGFESYAILSGQPLADQPSRLEQCLAIRTAMDDGFETVPKSLNPFHGVFVVEDYLGDCDPLVSTYKKALRKLDPDGNDPATRHREKPICSTETAPFLAAEHLHLYYAQRSKSFGEWLDELPRKRPGYVFLPFLVLGQYRAGGVWMFQGSFASEANARLHQYLKEVGNEAERWLATTSSQAVLEVASILLLKSLTHFKNLIGMPLAECHLAQQALASLWYKKETTSHQDAIPDGKEWEIGQRTGISQKIAVKVAYGKNVADLLGFETARYTCPYVPRMDLTADVKEVVEVFRDISEAAASVYRGSITRIRQVMNRQAAITAHDYANGLGDLMAIAGPEFDDCGYALGPDLRLRVVNGMAEGLLGHAWVARGIARQSHEISLETFTTELELRDEDPNAEDLEFWRRYLRQEAIFTAFSSTVTARRASGEFKGRMIVRYRFHGDTSEGPWHGNRDWEEIEIGPAALQTCLNGSAPQGFVPWPAPLDANKTKLLEAGQRSVMMWGARELLRNACGDTAFHASTRAGTWTVSVDVKIQRISTLWGLSVEVANPWTKLNEKPPTINKISAWPNDIRLVLNNVRFRDGARSDDAVSYIYEFEVRHGSAKSGSLLPG